MACSSRRVPGWMWSLPMWQGKKLQGISTFGKLVESGGPLPPPPPNPLEGHLESSEMWKKLKRRWGGESKTGSDPSPFFNSEKWVISTDRKGGCNLFKRWIDALAGHKEHQFFAKDLMRPDHKNRLAGLHVTPGLPFAHACYKTFSWDVRYS